MREIKFRVWDEYKKEMFYDEFFIDSDGTPYWNSTQNTASVELMQYTGLDDKNGKEIYEGDIIAYIHESVYHFLERKDDKPSGGIWFQKKDGTNINGKGTEKVIYGRKCEVVEWQEKLTGYFPFADSPENCGHCGGGSSPESFEVIGNIYENQELLK